MREKRKAKNDSWYSPGKIRKNTKNKSRNDKLSEKTERPNIPKIYDNKLWFGLFTLNNKKYQIRSQSKSWTDAVYLKEA